MSSQSVLPAAPGPVRPPASACRCPTCRRRCGNSSPTRRAAPCCCWSRPSPRSFGPTSRALGTRFLDHEYDPERGRLVLVIRRPRLGQRRRDGDFLSVGGWRSAARRPSGISGPAPRGRTGMWGDRRTRAAGVDLLRVRSPRPGRTRLGHSDVHGHRVPDRNPRAVRPALPRPAATIPADAGDRRRHRRHYGHGAVLHAACTHGFTHRRRGLRARRRRAAVGARLALWPTYSSESRCGSP